ncbi:MAG: isoprenylcysteine carboxylmethyltransferase family protein [Phycisphaeraceae bacterium]|nr:isoprenylcysteine carboxylmethyltransferase family protein [Phycisphaeraceae bacterium]
MMPVWARAIVFTVLVPGTVAGILPGVIIALTGARIGTPIRWWGWVGIAMLGAGASLYVWTASLFVARGLGTPAPWDAPRRLVTTGPYAISRNPMYAAVLAVIAGEALLAGSVWVAVYGAAVFVAFYERTVRYEEPTLRREFGAEFESYCRRVGRFIGRGGQA